MICQRFSPFKSRRHVHLFCIFLFPAFLVVSKASAQTNSGSSWSGTITYTYTRTVHHAAPYSETSYLKWDKHYEQYMEAKVVNGTGTAKSTITLIDSNLTRDKMGSRTVTQWDVEKGTAEGTDNTEVSIFIYPDKGTYNIEAPIPETDGKKTKTFYCEGCGQAPAEPITSGMGEDATSIEVEDEKTGSNPNVLSGEKTERKQIDNGEGEEITVTRWMFTKVKK